MSLLSSDELSAIRADVVRMLPDSCTILSPSDGVDSQGFPTTTWGTATANVACRLDPFSSMKPGEEVIISTALQARQKYLMTLPYNTAVTNRNRIAHNAYTYAVVSVDVDKTWPVSLRLVVERL